MRALFKVMNDLLTAADEGGGGGGGGLALLDLRAAFDTIDHNILWDRLLFLWNLRDCSDMIQLIPI